MAKVDVKGALRKLRKAEKVYGEQSYEALKLLGSLGKTKARELVYYDTGFTYRSIRKETKKTKNPTSRIFIEPYYRPNNLRLRPDRSKYQNFSLVRWSHQSPLAKGHFKSGRPTFLYDTRDYLRRISKKKVTGLFKNVKIR